MGRGTIISNLGEGQYTVRLDYGQARYLAAVQAANDQIDYYEGLLATLAEGTTEYDLCRVQMLGLSKRLAWLTDHAPEEPEISAWCADYTVDLSGDVGTVEIPDERGTVLIKPSYTMGRSADASDGQIVPAVAMTPAQAFFNRAIMPATQLRLPRYRTGTVANLNVEAATCDVSLDAAESSIQGRDVNEESSLAGVPIEYMTCNAEVFENGDHVVVEFQARDWSGPRVIGFVDHPERCTIQYLVLEVKASQLVNGIWTAVPSYAVIWDVAAGAVAAGIPDGLGGELSYPCPYADTAYFRGQAAQVTGYALFSETALGDIPDMDTWESGDPHYLEGFCNPAVYTYSVDGIIATQTFEQDIYRLDVHSPPGGQDCIYREQSQQIFNGTAYVGLDYALMGAHRAETRIGDLPTAIRKYLRYVYYDEVGGMLQYYAPVWWSSWDSLNGHFIDGAELYVQRVAGRYADKTLYQQIRRTQAVIRQTQTQQGDIDGDPPVEFWCNRTQLALSARYKPDGADLEDGYGEPRTGDLEAAVRAAVSAMAAANGHTVYATPDWPELANEGSGLEWIYTDWEFARIDLSASVYDF
ncbi:MAG: hypothetical protein ACOWWM_12705 [Desulfobacterales bacterium]